MTFIPDRIYKVTFWDHCLGKDESVKCTIVGYFLKLTERDYVFTHWLCEDEDYNEIEFTTIMKNSVISKRLLR